MTPVSATSHASQQGSAEACAQCARTRGCKVCFEELVRRFQSPLLHFLMRRLGSRHDAEDVLQETFLIAYRQLATYQPAWRFSTWLFTIAHRLAVSKKRRRRWAVRLVPSLLVEKFSASDPQAKAQENEQRSKLWDSANQILSPDAFTAIWLSYVESMSAEEIGQVLDRSANGVRILLHRARSRLMEHMGSDWKSGAES
jgi:RNA polymerase sigma-70 factor (ECF subfamily)